MSFPNLTQCFPNLTQCFPNLTPIGQVEEKPDVTYSDVGGCKDSIEKLREVVELPLLHPERFARLGIDPPKGILL